LKGHAPPLQRITGALLWWGLHGLCWGVASVGRLLYDIEAHGLEHLTVKGPLILAPRRISRIDFLGAALALSDRQVFKSLGLGASTSLTGLMTVFNSRWLARIGREMGFLPA
jgi:hypothetical protein